MGRAQEEEKPQSERVCRSGVKTRKSESHRIAIIAFAVLLTLIEAACKAVSREGEEEAPAWTPREWWAASESEGGIWVTGD